MTLFAGMYSLDKGVRPDPEMADVIKRTISRADDDVEVYSDKRLFLAKIDVGAFREPAFMSDPQSGVAAIVGEPLLDPKPDPPPSRKQDLVTLVERLDGGDTSVLRDCQGTFALCYYSNCKR